MVMGQLKILIRQYNFTKKLVMAKRCLDAVLSFCWFLTDLKLNERIRRSWLADHGSCGDTALRLLYQIQKSFTNKI